MSAATVTWHDAAPPKRSKRQAVADLEYCIRDEADRANYRVIQRGSRWIIQAARRITAMPAPSHSLHTRAIIRARNDGDLFWRRTMDFGIRFQDHATAADDPKVVQAMADLRKTYDIVQASFRDC